MQAHTRMLQMVTPCSRIDIYKHTAFIIRIVYPEDGGSRFLRNIRSATVQEETHCTNIAVLLTPTCVHVQGFHMLVPNTVLETEHRITTNDASTALFILSKKFRVNSLR